MQVNGSYMALGLKEKMLKHIERLDLKFYSLINIKMMGHTKGGLRPTPMRPGSPNDRKWQGHTSTHTLNP